MKNKSLLRIFFACFVVLLIVPLKAEASSIWSFCSGEQSIKKDEEISMRYREYKDFDLLKENQRITEKKDNADDYTVVWKSSNEDAVWINKRTGQARANKFDTLLDETATVRISAVITNNKTGKQIVRAFVVAVDNRAFTKKTETPLPTPEVTPTPEVVAPTVTPIPEPTATPVEPNDGTSTYIKSGIKKITLGSTWKSDMSVLTDTIDFKFGDKVLSQSDILGIDQIDCTEIGSPTNKTYIRTISIQLRVIAISPDWESSNHYIVEKVAINHYFDVIQ